MDTASESPALALYRLWHDLINHYNPNLKETIEKRLKQELPTHSAGKPWEGTAYNQVQIDHNLALVPYVDRWDQGAIMLCWGPIHKHWRNPSHYPLMVLFPSGEFMLSESRSRAWKALAAHTFIAHASSRGNLISVSPVSPQSGHGWDFSPHDIHKRQPYLRQGRWSEPITIYSGVNYYLRLDERGYWRFAARQDDVGGVPCALRAGYAATDKLYSYRRKRTFKNAGIPDPEVRRIIQQPVADALAKAFVPYTPAAPTFKSRPKPTEAAHG